MTHIQLSADVVLFCLKDGKLHLALVQRDSAPFEGAWSLPGSFVRPKEDTDLMGAVLRCLYQKLGLVKKIYVEQLVTVGSGVRDPRGWSASVAYVGLTEPVNLGEGAKWCEVSTLPSLPFDHKALVELASERVKNKVSYSALGLHALSSPFTLTELQVAYEALLGQKQNVRTFRRRVEELSMVVPAKSAKCGAHRPAALFKPNEKLQEQGLIVAPGVFEKS